MGETAMSQEIRRLARELSAHLAWQALGGATELPVAALAGPVGAREDRDVTRSPAVVRTAGEPFAPEGGQPAEPGAAGLGEASDLDALRAYIGDCRRCRLCERRTQVVFGVGDPRARLAFVGEGPGHDEDVRGEPFVGRAGQLLTDIIEKGMRLRRAEVYICNVVKCRPPENRNPEPDEVAACGPFLARQIELVAPEAIVALGKFAAHTLLETRTPIMRLRGSWHEYRGIPVMPTLHPAYLLRNPADKKLVWQDIRQVMARLGMAP